MIGAMAILAVFVAAWPGMSSVETNRAFDRYIAAAEMRIWRGESSIASFLGSTADTGRWTEGDSAADEVFINPANPKPIEVSGGLIHDWVGVVLIPRASVPQVLRIVQDYDHFPRYYAPEVVASRLISRDGDDFHIFLRTREHRVITVVLDSEYDVKYGRLDSSHQFSFSRSRQITEVDNAGERNEHAASENHGYLWRLNSYWRFAQKGGDVVVECEAISLTRDIPVGLGWLIGPYISEIPRDALRSALIGTRDAVEAADHTTR